MGESVDPQLSTALRACVPQTAWGGRDKENKTFNILRDNILPQTIYLGSHKKPATEEQIQIP